MINSLTNIISHFPGAANRARCTAHIVNLVSKIILQQFDARKKTKGPKKKSVKVDNEINDMIMDNEPTNGAELEDKDDLDREEQDVADDKEDGMGNNIAADLEEIEEAMKEEIAEVVKKVKPIWRILFKVCFYFLMTCYIANVYCSLYISAPQTCLRNKKVNNNTPSSMEGNPGRTCHCRCRQ